MTLRRMAVATAGVVLAARAALWALGLEAHTCVLAGMPLDASSWVLGPLVVAIQLATWTVAPILLCWAALDRAAGILGTRVLRRSSEPAPRS
ncbi:MAG: hypothetical protein KC657_17055 [Myxococcales bacterium]|nr:hypothetical protein [Myxococcales bacterium]